MGEKIENERSDYLRLQLLIKIDYEKYSKSLKKGVLLLTTHFTNE